MTLLHLLLTVLPGATGAAATVALHRWLSSDGYGTRPPARSGSAAEWSGDALPAHRYADEVVLHR